MATIGRPRTCTCGECEKCRHREYMHGWYQRHRQPIEPQTCGMCGKTFTPSTSQKRKWCSASCKQRAVYWRKHTKEGKRCLVCDKDISDMRRDAKWCSTACSNRRPSAAGIRRKATLKSYGLTLEEYEAMLERQGGGCAICGTTEVRGFGTRQAVDHCHDSGLVRGILCGNCNRGIGAFKHDPDRLAAAVDYLRRD